MWRSQFRVTRKMALCRTVKPGKRSPACAAMRSSSERERAAGGGRHREEPRQHGGDLHDREEILPHLPPAPAPPPLAPQEQGDVEGLVAQVRERVPGVDGERRERREHVVREVGARRGGLLRGEVARRHDEQPGAGELGNELLAPGPPSLLDERVRARRHRRELLGREEPVRRGLGDAARDLLLQPGDPDHEELVEVRADDAEELEALEERQRAIARLLEDALVELEPRELAVDEETRVVETHGRPPRGTVLAGRAGARGRGRRWRLEDHGGTRVIG